MKTVIRPNKMRGSHLRNLVQGVLVAVGITSGFASGAFAVDSMMPSSIGADPAMMQPSRSMANPVSSLPGPSGTAVGTPVATDSQPSIPTAKSVAMPSIAAPAMLNQSPASGTPPATAPAPSASISLPSPGNDTSAPSDTHSSANTQKKNDKALSVLEDKITDTAKEAMNRMGASTSDTTLDDMNAAKMAVTKIDALIEIEKKLADLEKIRQERKKETVSATPPVPVMPASAFQPPSLPMPVAQPAPAPVKQVQETPPPVEASFASAAKDIDVKRITGIDGLYTATLESGGQTRTVHAGDKLPDGSLVTAISSSGITLLQKSKTRQIDIKGVDKVFGRTF